MKARRELLDGRVRQMEKKEEACKAKHVRQRGQLLHRPGGVRIAQTSFRCMIPMCFPLRLCVSLAVVLNGGRGVVGLEM